MDVKQIIKKVSKLALNGDVLDDPVAVEDILSYINTVYNDIATSLFSETNTGTQRISDYTVVDGVSTLTPIPYKVFNVVDINRKKKLKPANLIEIEEADPLVEREGNPEVYYFLQNTLYTYPKNNTQLRVRHVNKLPDLTLETTEEQILFPPQYHEVLVWGVLYYMAYDERDFQQALEFQVTSSNFNSWKDRLLNYYYYNVYTPVQTKTEDM